MNFNPVGRTKDGEFKMKFHNPFTIVEKMQLLQRSILVNSFAYYELNENILTDFQYDANARQLIGLIKEYPKEFKRTRYYEYFYDYCPEDENIHYTSGFDLLDRLKKTDKGLYRRVHLDAVWALELKNKYGTEGYNV